MFMVEKEKASRVKQDENQQNNCNMIIQLQRFIQAVETYISLAQWRTFDF